MRELIGDSHHGFRGQVIIAVENLNQDERRAFDQDFPEWGLFLNDPDSVDEEYESWVSDWIENNTAMMWEKGDLYLRKYTEPRDVQIRVLEKLKAHGFKHFDMSNWFQMSEMEEITRWDWDGEVREYVETPGVQWISNSAPITAACEIDIDNCGTTACLAGFAALVACELGDDEDVFGHGDNYRSRSVANYLGVNSAIFHKGEWPRWMQEAWDEVEIESPHVLVDEEELTGDEGADQELIERRDNEYRDWVVITGFLEDLIAGELDGNGYHINGGLQHQ